MDYLSLLILLALTFGVVSKFFDSWRTMTRIPQSIKWAGRRRQLFSRARACGRELFGRFTKSEVRL